MVMKQEDIHAPIKDNETWNSCIYCGATWKDETPTLGLLHRTTVCVKCKNNPLRRYKNVRDVETPTN